jgi:hypothetical protein
MPNALPRPSLTIDLATRYATQPVGGAFNARNIIDGINQVDGLFASYQSAQFQNFNGFLTDMQVEVSDFKNQGNDLSIFVQNLNTTPYDASGIPAAGLS